MSLHLTFWEQAQLLRGKWWYKYELENHKGLIARWIQGELVPLCLNASRSHLCAVEQTILHMYWIRPGSHQLLYPENLADNIYFNGASHSLSNVYLFNAKCIPCGMICLIEIMISKNATCFSKWFVALKIGQGSEKANKPSGIWFF